MKLIIKFVLSFAFLISIISTYSYIDFYSSMSVGMGHVYTAKSLALSHNFNLDEGEYWGNAGVDVFKYNGHRYVAYAPLNAVLMAIPYFVLQVFYFILNKIGILINGDISIILESLAFSLPSSLAFLGIGILVYKILLGFKIQHNRILLSLLGLLFGSILLNYSVSFFNHVISAFFILAAYYALTKNSLKGFFYSGIFTGLAFLTEYPTVLFSAGLLVVEMYRISKKERKIKESFNNFLIFAFPVLTGILLMGIFNWYHFGNPFLFSEVLLGANRIVPNLTIHTPSQNVFYGLFGLYLSPIKGLFLISPFLLFSFIGIKSFYIRYPEASIIATSYIILISLTYSLWPDCFGATPMGPRYLISVIPFLGIISVFGINSKKNLWIYLILIIYSIYICLFNMLDGLPSGIFGDCNIFDYGAMMKANSYVSKTFSGNIHFAPIILKSFFQN